MNFEKGDVVIYYSVRYLIIKKGPKKREWVIQNINNKEEELLAEEIELKPEKFYTFKKRFNL